MYYVSIEKFCSEKHSTGTILPQSLYSGNVTVNSIITSKSEVSKHSNNFSDERPMSKLNLNVINAVKSLTSV